MQDDEKEIRELIETWMSATRAGDTGAVLDLMAEDAIFLVAGHPPFGKEQFQKGAEEHADASVQFDAKSEILELKILDDWAFMITKLSVTTNQSGKPPIKRSGHTLTILNKQSGRWLLARDANLLTPDAE